jgi:hypothetical protein
MANGAPALIINPRGDGAFVSFVQHQMETGAASTAALESRLRARYPLASVHERALSGEARATWYVYREGKWIP